MAVTAVGSVAAKEVKPYKVTELRLAQGSTDYDLMEGITYNAVIYYLSINQFYDSSSDDLLYMPAPVTYLEPVRKTSPI